MKRLRALEVSLYRDIFFTIMGVIITIPLWLSFNTVFASTLNGGYITYDVDDKYITVTNKYKVDSNYILLLKTDRTIDDSEIRLNYITYSLSDYKKYTDGKYIYYYLDSKTLNNDSYYYEVILNTSDDINYEFIVNA